MKFITFLTLWMSFFIPPQVQKDSIPKIKEEVD